eukprot:m.109482 g.109482  ORF g.109482 m.109482 type:complete len:273 (+) comp51766_c0_seq5:164-982(+)
MPQTQIRDQLLTKFRSGCSTRSWQKWAPSILQADSAFAPDQSGILQDARLYSSLFDSTPPSASVQRLAAFLRSARNARIVILLGHGLTSHGPISLSENWMLVQADPLERHLRFVRRGDILASIAGYISPSWFLAQLSASPTKLVVLIVDSCHSGEWVSFFQRCQLPAGLQLIVQSSCSGSELASSGFASSKPESFFSSRIDSPSLELIPTISTINATKTFEKTCLSSRNCSSLVVLLRGMSLKKPTDSDASPTQHSRVFCLNACRLHCQYCW